LCFGASRRRTTWLDNDFTKVNDKEFTKLVAEPSVVYQLGNQAGTIWIPFFANRVKQENKKGVQCNCNILGQNIWRYQLFLLFCGPSRFAYQKKSFWNDKLGTELANFLNDHVWTSNKEFDDPAQIEGATSNDNFCISNLAEKQHIV
jgi:hypothetical protein